VSSTSPRLPTLKLAPRSSDWRAEALCRGLDGRGGHCDFTELPTPEQRRFCRACPVNQACLEDVLAVDATLGRFDQAATVPRAGLTALQRAALIAQRRGATS
jgi:hypothetical protein